MAYLITHFYEGGTEEQYRAVLAAVHPEGGLPAGQQYHVAGPCDGGFQVAAVWDSKASNDTFINDVLLPTLPKVEGGFQSPPQEHAGEVANLATA